MLVKLWSKDHRIKRLVSVYDFEDLKNKALEVGICSRCPGRDLKVFLEDGTEVEEASFQCMLENSLGELNYVCIVTSEDPDTERPSASTSGGTSQIVERLIVPFSSLPEEILTALNSSTALKSTQHQELVRMIATAMCKVIPRPSAKDIRAVASHVGAKYPEALRDRIATSRLPTFHGLAHKIECRIVNARRGCKRLAMEISGGATKRATVRTTYGCVQWQPSVEKNRKDDYERAKKILALENMKGEEEQDMQLQKELMESAYPAIRLTINTQNNSASDVRREWPLLFKRHHFLAHFKRLTDRDLQGLFTEKRIPNVELLHAFFRHHGKTNEALVWILKIERAAQEIDRSTALLTGLFPMMCLFFKEKIKSIFYTIEATTDIDEIIGSVPQTPVVLALGRSIFDCTCIVSLDGARILEGFSFLEAMEVLFAAYYCLNLKYPPEVAATLEFIQRQLVDMNPEEGSRQSSRKVPLIHPKVQGAFQELATFKKMWLRTEAFI